MKETPQEKVLHLLVKKLNGHSVTIIREGVGELVGFSVSKGRSIAIDDLIAVVHEADSDTPSQPKKRTIDCGQFEEWSVSELAAQCRMQAQEQLDPEFCQFMAEVSNRLAASTPAPQTHLRGWVKVEEDMPLELLKSINSENQVLAYENGRYYNAWFEFEPSEGGWVWMDEADSEPNPSHYRMLSEIALATEGKV